MANDFAARQDVSIPGDIFTCPLPVRSRLPGCPADTHFGWGRRLPERPCTLAGSVGWDKPLLSTLGDLNEILIIRLQNVHMHWVRYLWLVDRG